MIGKAVKGLVAGAVGTVALTLSEQAEMLVTGRQPSLVPGEVGNKLRGREPADDPEIEQTSQLVHWGHGVSMGVLRAAVVKVTKLRGAPATAVHFAAVWGGDAALYKQLGIADVPWRWTASELATDLLNKGVYAIVVGVAYDTLTARG